MLLCAFGLLIGALFGSVVQRTHFCTMGAISDRVLFGDTRRARAWLLAIGTALASTQLLAAAGLAAPATSGPLVPALGKGGVALGALLFGYGTTLAGGCLSRCLARAGAGSLKALSVVVIAAFAALLVFAAFALSGADVRLPAGGPATGATPFLAQVIGIALGLVLVATAFAAPRFRASRRDWIGGLAIGCLTAAAWSATSFASGAGAGATVQGIDFALWAPRVWLGSSGGTGAGAAFALTIVLGTIAGSACAAWLDRTWRLERFTGKGDLKRHLLGAVLMGAGGALAGGCTIGQGVTGVSTMAPVALVALAGFVAGGASGIKALEAGGLGPLLGAVGHALHRRARAAARR